MARRWRLNPPPNWPSPPEGWEPGPDWAPQREWGPAPVGWTLWRREGRGAWLARHRRSAGLGSAAMLTIFVALAGPPATGTLEGAVPEPAEAAPSVTGGTVEPRTPVDRPLAEPVVRLRRRTSPASRERRPAAARVAETTTGTVEPSADPRDRRRKAVTAPDPSASPSAAACPPEPESPGPQPPAPDATSVPEPDPFVAGSEPGCTGAGGRVGFPPPTTSGSPEPPGRAG